MKITKTILRKIINEELGRYDEAEGFETSMGSDIPKIQDFLRTFSAQAEEMGYSVNDALIDAGRTEKDDEYRVLLIQVVEGAKKLSREIPGVLEASVGG